MLRPRLYGEFTTVATISAAIVISIFSWLSSLIPPLTGSDVGVRFLVLKYLTATGTYFLIFKLLLFAYSYIGWRLLHRSMYLGGRWKYAYNDTFNTTTGTFGGADKQGEARFEHGPDLITLSAESEDPSVPTHIGARHLGVWKAMGTGVEHGQVELWMTFVGRFSPAMTTKGALILNIIPAPFESRFDRWNPFRPPPRELRGFYYLIDTAGTPPINLGSVVFHRTD